MTCVSGRFWRLEAISSTSSMKTDDAVEEEQLVEELAQRARASDCVVPDELARKDLDERPSEAAGYALREGGLPGPRRPEEHNRRGRGDPVPLRLFPLGKRQDDAPLDQLLLALHAADRLPQLGG
jgi:hypothetical protein